MAEKSKVASTPQYIAPSTEQKRAIFERAFQEEDRPDFEGDDEPQLSPEQRQKAIQEQEAQRQSGVTPIGDLIQRRPQSEPAVEADLGEFAEFVPQGARPQPTPSPTPQAGAGDPPPPSNEPIEIFETVGSIGSELGGAALGAATPIPGGTAAGAILGGGVGATIGGELDDLINKARGIENPEERSAVLRFLQGSAGSAIGLGIGAAAGRVMRKAGEAAEPLSRAGVRRANRMAQARQVLAKQTGIPLRVDQINLENAEVRNAILEVVNQGGSRARHFQAVQLGQNQKLLNEFENILLESAPLIPKNRVFQPQEIFEKFVDSHQKTIKTGFNAARIAAGGQRFDVSSLLRRMRVEIQQSFGDVFDKNALMIPDAADSQQRAVARYYNNLMRRNQSPTRRLTLKEMDRQVDLAQKAANFKKKDRGNIDRLWGSLSFEARKSLDNMTLAVLERKGRPELAAELRAAKDSFAGSIDKIREFQKLLKEQPQNFIDAIVKKRNPEQVRQFLGLIDEEGKQFVSGGFLNKLYRDNIDKEFGSVSASAMEKALNGYDPKILKLVLGDELGRLKKTIRIAKVIERTNISPRNPRTENLLRDYAEAVAGHYGRHRLIASMLTGLISRNKEASEILVPKIVSLAPDKSKIGDYLLEAARRGQLTDADLLVLRAAVGQGVARIPPALVNSLLNQPAPEPGPGGGQ